MITQPIDLPMAEVPEEWREPAFVQWATALAEEPTYERVTPPTEDEAGSIYESLYREKVLGQAPRKRTRKRSVSVEQA